MQVPSEVAVARPSGARLLREGLEFDPSFKKQKRLHTLEFGHLVGLAAAKGASGASWSLRGPGGKVTTTVIRPPLDRALPLLIRREVATRAGGWDSVYLLASAGDRLEGARLLDPWKQGARVYLPVPAYLKELAVASSGTIFGGAPFDLLTQYGALLWAATVRGNVNERAAAFRTARDAFLAHDRASYLVEAWFGRVEMLRVTRDVFKCLSP